MEEFIVDCTNNSDEEKAEVYKWLVETRGYHRTYLNSTYDCIACNEVEGNSHWETLTGAKQNFPEHPVYTFEEFKIKYLEKKRRHVKRKRNERIDVGCFREDIF